MASVTVRAKAIKKKGYSLFLDIYNGGQRYKEYLKLYVSKDYTKAENKNIQKEDKYNWELANAIQAKRIILIKENDAGFVPKANNQDFFIYYKKQAAKKNHSTYASALKHLTEFNGCDTLPFNKINEKFLRDYIKYLKCQEISVTTIRLYLSRFSIILNLGARDKLIQVNPFVYLTKGKGGDIPAKKPKKIEFLTIEELRKINDIDFRNDIKQYFLFSCFTGLRESDMLRLQWMDIKNNTLHYSQKKQDDSINHYLPLSKQAIELLSNIKVTQQNILGQISPFVFAHLQVKRTVLWNLKKMALKAGINKNIHIHVGRHTFATMALTNGVSLYTVSKMLGHSSIAVTQVYAEIIDEVKQKAADLMPML